MTATLDFLDFTVSEQMFILDESGINTPGWGIMGLGPNSGSGIRSVLNSTSGDPPLDRILRQNTSMPNILTIYLGRSDDPANPYPGNLTIGTTIPGYENITSMPKLPVTAVSNKARQHWQTTLDPNGVIGPDGQPVQVMSHVQGEDSNGLSVIFDTGFSISQVPR